MKKILLSTALFFAFASGFAQVKLVNKAFSEAKAESPNFAEAQKNIKEALENAETKDQAKTWYVAGFIDNKQFEIQRNTQLLGKQPNEALMYTSLISCYDYFMKAAELDQLPNEKGKVKPKYLKDIKNVLKNNQGYYTNGGAYFWEQKDYKKAYEMFHIYTEIPKLEIFKGEAFPADTNYNMFLYYAAIAASQIPDPKLAIQSYESLIGSGFKENEIYQLLSQEYMNVKDTAKYEQIMAEGAKKFPTEAYFIDMLINTYINKNQYDQAITYLDAAIARDAKNAQYCDAKGRLLETMKKNDDAMAMYKKAIEIDPNYAEAYGNIGRIFYNKAIEANNDAANIKDTKSYNEQIANVVKPLFKEAIPYYEKALQLKSEKEYMIALRSIYYNLQMGDDYDRIEKLMGGN
ncbi:MAG: tetratricopeptide repeat protein [Bacteroidales bacterium]|nr:tetratricopeptide repeat protein [Bacteroidales bacterium]